MTDELYDFAFSLIVAGPIAYLGSLFIRDWIDIAYCAAGAIVFYPEIVRRIIWLNIEEGDDK